MHYVPIIHADSFDPQALSVTNCGCSPGTGAVCRDTVATGVAMTKEDSPYSVALAAEKGHDTLLYCAPVREYIVPGVVSVQQRYNSL